jgi:hypothetical protein
MKDLQQLQSNACSVRLRDVRTARPEPFVDSMRALLPRVRRIVASARPSTVLSGAAE